MKPGIVHHEPYASTRVLCWMVSLAAVTNQRHSTERYLTQLLAWVAWSDRDIVTAECN